MKFVVKSLIALFVTGSALLLTPMRSDAQVNMKILTEVAKSCQNDLSSFDYYKRMGFNTSTINITFNYPHTRKESITSCIYSRYHYSLILEQYPWLASQGEILPGYPASVAVGVIANSFGGEYRTSIVDCIANQNVSSEECSLMKYSIEYANSNTDWYRRYPVNVCPSCVIANQQISSSKIEILEAFIQWFLKLDKPQRRELISLLDDGETARKLRITLSNKSEEAANKYWQVYQQVQQEEQERRRRELLGQ